MKKPDLAAIKQILFDKGEKIGLVGCTAIMVAVVGWSVYKGFAATGNETGKSWDVAITTKAAQVKEQIQRVELPEGEKPKSPDLDGKSWDFKESTYAYGPMFPRPDGALTKRLNPRILPPYPWVEGEKHFQMQYLPAAYFSYELDPPKSKVWVLGDGGAVAGAAKTGFTGTPIPPAPGTRTVGVGMSGTGVAGAGLGGANLSQVIRPVRMVVVSAIFPMREQLEEFRKSLRLASLGELMASRDLLPKPLAIEISRCEVLPNGKPVVDSKGNPWKEIVRFNAKTGKMEILSSTLKAMVRQMVIDEENPQELANFIFPGLVMPLPKLANAEYAKLDLKGLEPAQVVASTDAAAQGTTTTQPKFSFGVGPKKTPESATVAADGGAQGAVATVEYKRKLDSWAKAAPELAPRFDEKYFLFDPLGIPLAEDPKPAVGVTGAKSSYPSRDGPMSPMGVGMQGLQGAQVAGYGNPWERILGAAGATGMAGPMGSATSTPMTTTVNPDGGDQPVTPNQPQIELTDALIRFFDPDVQPGKTYCYTFRIRMSNPNFGKKDHVAYEKLAATKHLDHGTQAPHGWTITPTITIPGDYFFYATDQKPEKYIKSGADWSNAPPSWVMTTGRPEFTPLQVHRWLDRVNDQGYEYVVGDWAVAERLWTRRGEAIGRNPIMVEVPVWLPNRQAFEIAHAAQAVAKVKGKAAAPSGTGPTESGLPIELVTSPPHILVDFDGGSRQNVRIGTGNVMVPLDISAVEMLVLTPDGKLVARNSRADTDSEASSGQDRQWRYDHWRDRNRTIRDGAARPATMPAGPMGSSTTNRGS